MYVCLLGKLQLKNFVVRTFVLANDKLKNIDLFEYVIFVVENAW